MAYNSNSRILTEIPGALNVQQTTTPSTLPAAGYNLLYFKSDNNLYSLNSSGVEKQIDGGPITTSLLSVGNGVADSNNIIAARSDQNDKTVLHLTNSSLGVSAVAQVKITAVDDLILSGQSAAGGALAALGSGSGYVGGLNIESGAGGLRLLADGANSIVLKTNGATALTVTSTQTLLAPLGSAVAPSYSFNGQSGHGMYADSFNLNFTAAGTLYLQIGINGILSVLSSQAEFQDGSAALPSIAFNNKNSLGLFRNNANSLGITASGTLTIDVASAQTTFYSSVVIGAGALSTSATTGFLYIDSCAGTPTGIPVSYTGTVPLVVDTSNGRLWAYYGGAWHFAAFT